MIRVFGDSSTRSSSSWDCHVYETSSEPTLPSWLYEKSRDVSHALHGEFIYDTLFIFLALMPPLRVRYLPLCALWVLCSQPITEKGHPNQKEILEPRRHLLKFCIQSRAVHYNLFSHLHLYVISLECKLLQAGTLSLLAKHSAPDWHYTKKREQ